MLSNILNALKIADELFREFDRLKDDRILLDFICEVEDNGLKVEAVKRIADENLLYKVTARNSGKLAGSRCG